MIGMGNFDEVAMWLHNTTSKLPTDAANVIMSNTLTELRPIHANSQGCLIVKGSGTHIVSCSDNLR